MNNNNPVIWILKYFQMGKKNKELLSQPFANWGHPNPLMIFFHCIGHAKSKKRKSSWNYVFRSPSSKWQDEHKVKIQIFNSNKEFFNIQQN